MITKDHYKDIENKYGEFASWAIWTNEDIKPKSNIGDMSIFDLDKNPNLLKMLNPNVIMVALNFSRTIEKKAFVNFFQATSLGEDVALIATQRILCIILPLHYAR